MKKTIQAIILLLLSGSANAGNWNNPNPFVDMMRSMLDVFEMMQLYQDFSGQVGHSSRPYGYRQHLPSRPPVPGPASPFDQEQENDLEGAWASRNHILLAIKQNYARMYWSQEQYRDFYLEILPEHIRFRDASTGQVQEFEYRMQDEQLALRDNQGRVIQFFRLNTTGATLDPEPQGNFWDPNTQ